MFKTKNINAELPEIPSLSGFPEYREISETIAEKRSTLEARKAAANRIRSELNVFDVGDFNPRKTGLQNSLRTELQAQAQLEEELRGLETELSQIVTNISAQIARDIFGPVVSAMLKDEADRLREYAVMTERREIYIEKIERAVSGLGICRYQRTCSILAD
jgi:transposase